MQIGGGAEGLQEKILISTDSGASTRAVCLSIFVGVATKGNVEGGSEGDSKLPSQDSLLQALEEGKSKTFVCKSERLVTEVGTGANQKSLFWFRGCDRSQEETLRKKRMLIP